MSVLAIAYVAGIGRIAGAVIAGIMFASDGLFVSFLDKTLHIGQYQMIVAGIALAFTAVQNPNGVAHELVGAKGLAPRIVRLRDRVFPPPGSRKAAASGPAAAAPGEAAPPLDSRPSAVGR